MKVSQIKETDLSPELIDKLLFDGIEDLGIDADCIIVLGSRKAMINRVPTAVQAYKEGRAEKIMLCGGITSTTPGRTVSEADHMSLTAINMGVREADLLIENTSENTIENILCAMLELQRAFMLNKVKRVLFVTASFHMRRSIQLARYYFPNHIQVCPCPVDDQYFRKERWQKSQKTAETVLAEAKNLIFYVNSGIIPDFEI